MSEGRILNTQEFIDALAAGSNQRLIDHDEALRKRVAALEAALRSLMFEFDEARTKPVDDGNAPGHAHKDPPVRDDTGFLCELCLAWVAARALLSPVEDTA